MKKEFSSLPTSKQLQKELNREKYKQRFKRIVKSTFYTLLVVAAIAVLVATLVLPVLQISGTSMEPTLNNGEIVVLFKTSLLKRGDLCGFSYSNKILIKRVIGLPGDIIEIDDKGTVSVNGEIIAEPYITEKGLGECDIEFPFTVPEDQFFMMGDHRSTSIDSRSTVIGCVTKDQLIGKIFIKVWPLNKIKIIT